MPPIPGTVRIAGTMAPTDSTDVYAVTDPIYQKGGYQTCANATARLAITMDRRTIGMLVREDDTGMIYTLVGGIADINWTAQPVLSSGATVMTSGNVVSIVSGMNIPVMTSGNVVTIVSGMGIGGGASLWQQNGENLSPVASASGSTIEADRFWAGVSGIDIPIGNIVTRNSGSTLSHVTVGVPSNPTTLGPSTYGLALAGNNEGAGAIPATRIVADLGGCVSGAASEGVDVVLGVGGGYNAATYKLTPAGFVVGTDSLTTTRRVFADEIYDGDNLVLGNKIFDADMYQLSGDYISTATFSGDVVSVVSGMALTSGLAQDTYAVSGDVANTYALIGDIPDVSVYATSGDVADTYATSGNVAAKWTTTSGTAYVTSGLSLKAASGNYLLVGWAQASGVYMASGSMIANNSGTTLLSLSGVTATSGVATVTSGGTLNTLVTRMLVPSSGITYTLSGECIRINGDQLQSFSQPLFADDEAVVSGTLGFLKPICVIPSNMNNWWFIEAVGKVYDPAGNGDTDINIRSRNNATDTMEMITGIVIGAGAYYAKGNIKTAGSWNQIGTGDAFYAQADAIGTGNAPKGLVVTLTFARDLPATMP
jgi:hypothetical protein